MDHEHVLATFDDDELEEVAGTIGPSDQVARWVIVELEPGSDLVERVGNVFISNSVASRGRQDLN